MMHLKGDQNSTNAKYLQKALEKAAPSMRAQAQAEEKRYSHNSSLDDDKQALLLNKQLGFDGKTNFSSSRAFLKQEELLEELNKSNLENNNNQNFNLSENDKEGLGEVLGEVDQNDLALIEKLRIQRIHQLKQEQNKKQNKINQGYGSYSEISEEEFLPTVTKAERTVVHFYHREFERCKIMDKHLEALAPSHFETRFVKLNAEKSPFFVTKLNIKMLPSVILFLNGVAVDRVVGFDELGSVDDFETVILARRMASKKVLALHDHELPPDQQKNKPKPTNNGTPYIRQSQHVKELDSDEEFDD